MPVYFQKTYRNLGDLAWTGLHLNNVSKAPP